MIQLARCCKGRFQHVSQKESGLFFRFTQANQRNFLDRSLLDFQDSAYIIVAFTSENNNANVLGSSTILGSWFQYHSWFWYPSWLLVPVPFLVTIQFLFKSVPT